MKEKIWAQIAPYYARLNERQKILLLCAAVLLVFFILWSLIWQPVWNWRNTAKNSFQVQKGWNLWLSDHKQSLQFITASPTQADKNSLLGLVTQAATASNIKIKRFEPSKDGVKLWIDDVEYPKLLTWLHQMQNQHHLMFLQLKIDDVGRNGRVNVLLELG